MTDHSLQRADELLTELVEQVETARALPMSASCVLPRERLLDLLDELREVLPLEIEQSRRVIAARDTLLHDAFTEAGATREAAAAEARATLAAADKAAARLIHDAQVQAYDTIERGRSEHAALVSATTVHTAAHRAAADLREHAEHERRAARADADSYTMRVRADARAYAAKLVADSENYADRTLYDLTVTLQRAAATADQGRLALAKRRTESSDGPAIPDALDDEPVATTTEPAVSAASNGIESARTDSARIDAVPLDSAPVDAVPTDAATDTGTDADTARTTEDTGAAGRERVPA